MMALQDIALTAAGTIGAGVALAHGLIIERRMVQPLQALAVADGRVNGPIRRLIPVLLHLSTACWFAGGLALIAAQWFDDGARLATATCVGALYLFGVVGNFWATRGRHPGWMLLSAALLMIGFGLRAP